MFVACQPFPVFSLAPFSNTFLRSSLAQASLSWGNHEDSMFYCELSGLNVALRTCTEALHTLSPHTQTVKIAYSMSFQMEERSNKASLCNEA